MDHEAAAPLIAELAAGRDLGTLGVEVRAHAAGCEECGRVLATGEKLRRELDAHGAALFTPHPDADALAAWALAPGELPTDTLAAIGLHVRACPACGADVAAARAANREPALLGWISALRPERAGPWLAPALAAGLLILAWPAYLGIVELPRARRAAEPRSRVAPAPSLEGALPSVLLTSEVRGERSRPAAVRLDPGARGMALIASADATVLPTSGMLHAALADSGGRVAWRIAFAAGTAWSPDHRLITLFVPAQVLARSTDWTLSISATPAGPPGFTGRFRILGEGKVTD